MQFSILNILTKKNTDLESAVEKLIIENRDLEKKIGSIKGKVDQYHDKFEKFEDESYIKNSQAYLERLVERKMELLGKKADYMNKLQHNKIEFTELYGMIDGLEEYYNKTKHRLRLNIDEEDNYNYEIECGKIEDYISLLIKEISDKDLIEEINHDEKKIVNFIPEKITEEVENNKILHNSLNLPKNRGLMLPNIQSNSSMKIKRSADFSENALQLPISYIMEEDIDNIFKIDNDILDKDVSNIEYTSLCKTLKIMKQSNKTLLKEIEHVDHANERQITESKNAFLKNKSNLDYIKKENDTLSL